MEEFSRLNFKIPGTQPHTIPWVWILRTSPTIRSFLRQGYSYFQNHLRRLHYAFHLKGPDEVFKMFVELNTTLCIFKAFINWLLRLHREIWFNNKKPWRGAWYWPVLTVAQQNKSNNGAKGIQEAYRKHEKLQNSMFNGNLSTSDTYSGPCQTSKMEQFVKIDNCKPLTTFAKSSNLNVRNGSKQASVL